MAYNFKVLFEKRKRLPYRLQRKSENVNAMIQSRLNVGIVNQELNQYDDLLKLFLDTPYQYHSKVEDSQQTGWQLVSWGRSKHIYIQTAKITSKIMTNILQENHQRVRGHQYK